MTEMIVQLSIHCLFLLQSTEALVNSAAGYKLLPKYHQLNAAKKTLIPAFEFEFW